MRLDLTRAALACRYVAERVRAASGERWVVGPVHPARPCRQVVPEVRLFAERRLRGVPEPAACALVGWADGQRPALLRFDAPPARELLALQARGRRCVSLLDGPGGLDFALHDLCHLEKFTDPAQHREQVGYFALLDRALDQPGWRDVEAGLDEEWGRGRDAVLADMNGSPLFLHCALRSRLEQAAARAGVPSAPRLGIVHALLGLDGPLAAAAAAMSSRKAPGWAAEALLAHFRAAGAAALEGARL